MYSMLYLHSSFYRGWKKK